VSQKTLLWDPLANGPYYTYAGPTKSPEKAAISDIKEVKSLFGRLMVISKSSRDINQADAIGEFEFTTIPRSLFAADKSLLPCLDKSKLVHQLEQVVADQEVNNNGPAIAIIDGMTMLQKMQKLPDMKSMLDLGQQFVATLKHTTAKFTEVHLVFDTYKAKSLKTATRQRRKQAKEVTYKVVDQTKIKSCHQTEQNKI
jgi:hypothetical protein